MSYSVPALANLDYLFEYSSRGILEENIIVRGAIVPANGGSFMVAPTPGDLERANELIKKKERLSLGKSGKRFDVRLGWGHKISHWEGLRVQNGENWSWYGASGDQGLLYHWVYHVKRRFSVIVPSRILGEDPLVENWVPSPENDDSIKLKHSFTLKCKAKEKVKMWGDVPSHPFPDLMHFVRKDRKPWIVRPNWKWSAGRGKYRSEKDFWWASLEAVHNKWDLGFDINQLKQFGAGSRNQATQTDALDQGLLTNLLDEERADSQ